MSRAPADQSAEALIALYAQAWERVRALQTEALTAGTESQRRRKMRELMQLVKALAEQLDDAGYRWASSEFPRRTHSALSRAYRRPERALAGPRSTQRQRQQQRWWYGGSSRQPPRRW